MTGTGRIVGGITMVVGISTFAIVTAKAAEWLVRVRRGDDLEGASDLTLVASVSPSITDQLLTLSTLRQAGDLTEAEFAAAKAQLLEA